MPAEKQTGSEPATPPKPLDAHESAVRFFNDARVWEYEAQIAEKLGQRLFAATSQAERNTIGPHSSTAIQARDCMKEKALRGGDDLIDRLHANGYTPAENAVREWTQLCYEGRFEEARVIRPRAMAEVDTALEGAATPGGGVVEKPKSGDPKVKAEIPDAAPPPDGAKQALFRSLWRSPPWFKWPVIILIAVVLGLFALWATLPEATKQKLLDWIVKQL